MSDVINEEERHEAATEEPTTVGCPSLVPGKLPGGFDGVEQESAGRGGRDGTELEELKRRGAKLKACNDRSYAKMNEIARIANECIQRTTHAAYMPGQYGEDYRAFGRAFCEIRKLVGPGLAGRFGVAPADGVYYTPDWLAKLAKEIEAHDKPIDPTAKKMEDKAAKQAKYKREHLSFCDGLFPIRICNTEDGQMAICWIGGRLFTLDLDNKERDDGGHDCAAVIRDNGKVVATIETQRGKAISFKLAYGAFRSYVMNLSGSGKYTSRGGFLKTHAKRAAAKALADGSARAGQEVAR